uniref:Spt20-like SEP domain-containing protein n=1 Tax=Palpitomonas bilix TaxID=652834 RepID=A0A7S3G0D7_9EUKA|mmetsp:Transcript_11516/g.30633  ORF Transcript_11516/g.30633 Transcript_11516/m.30633 type:complete len:1807 (+) Transcript_11516:329-5749(+)
MSTQQGNGASAAQKGAVAGAAAVPALNGAAAPAQTIATTAAATVAGKAGAQVGNGHVGGSGGSGPVPAAGRGGAASSTTATSQGGAAPAAAVPSAAAGRGVASAVPLQGAGRGSAGQAVAGQVGRPAATSVAANSAMAGRGSSNAAPSPSIQKGGGQGGTGTTAAATVGGGSASAGVGAVGRGTTSPAQAMQVAGRGSVAVSPTAQVVGRGSGAASPSSVQGRGRGVASPMQAAPAGVSRSVTSTTSTPTPAGGRGSGGASAVQVGSQGSMTATISAQSGVGRGSGRGTPVQGRGRGSGATSPVQSATGKQLAGKGSADAMSSPAGGGLGRGTTTVVSSSGITVTTTGSYYSSPAGSPSKQWQSMNTPSGGQRQVVYNTANAGQKSATPSSGSASTPSSPSLYSTPSSSPRGRGAGRGTATTVQNTGRQSPAYSQQKASGGQASSGSGQKQGTQGAARNSSSSSSAVSPRAQSYQQQLQQARAAATRAAALGKGVGMGMGRGGQSITNTYRPTTTTSTRSAPSSPKGSVYGKQQSNSRPASPRGVTAQRGGAVSPSKRASSPAVAASKKLSFSLKRRVDTLGRKGTPSNILSGPRPQSPNREEKSRPGSPTGADKKKAAQPPSKERAFVNDIPEGPPIFEGYTALKDKIKEHHQVVPATCDEELRSYAQDLVETYSKKKPSLSEDGLQACMNFQQATAMVRPAVEKHFSPITFAINKLDGLQVSMVLSMYKHCFSIDNGKLQPLNLSNESVRSFLNAIDDGVLTPEIEALLKACNDTADHCSTKYYDGCVVVEFRDYRFVAKKGIKPDVKRVLLKPDLNTIVNGIASVLEETGRGDYMGYAEEMEIESKVLAASKPVCTDPNPRSLSKAIRVANRYCPYFDRRTKLPFSIIMRRHGLVTKPGIMKPNKVDVSKLGDKTCKELKDALGGKMPSFKGTEPFPDTFSHVPVPDIPIHPPYIPEVTLERVKKREYVDTLTAEGQAVVVAVKRAKMAKSPAPEFAQYCGPVHGYGIPYKTMIKHKKKTVITSDFKFGADKKQVDKVLVKPLFPRRREVKLENAHGSTMILSYQPNQRQNSRIARPVTDDGCHYIVEVETHVLGSKVPHRSKYTAGNFNKANAYLEQCINLLGIDGYKVKSDNQPRPPIVQQGKPKQPVPQPKTMSPADQAGAKNAKKKPVTTKTQASPRQASPTSASIQGGAGRGGGSAHSSPRAYSSGQQTARKMAPTRGSASPTAQAGARPATAAYARAGAATTIPAAQRQATSPTAGVAGVGQAGRGRPVQGTSTAYSAAQLARPVSAVASSTVQKGGRQTGAVSPTHTAYTAQQRQQLQAQAQARSPTQGGVRSPQGRGASSPQYTQQRAFQNAASPTYRAQPSSAGSSPMVSPQSQQVRGVATAQARQGVTVATAGYQQQGGQAVTYATAGVGKGATHVVQAQGSTATPGQKPTYATAKAPAGGAHIVVSKGGQGGVNVMTTSSPSPGGMTAQQRVANLTPQQQQALQRQQLLVKQAQQAKSAAARAATSSMTSSPIAMTPQYAAAHAANAANAGGVGSAAQQYTTAAVASAAAKKGVAVAGVRSTAPVSAASPPKSTGIAIPVRAAPVSQPMLGASAQQSRAMPVPSASSQVPQGGRMVTSPLQQGGRTVTAQQQAQPGAANVASAVRPAAATSVASAVRPAATATVPSAVRPAATAAVASAVRPVASASVASAVKPVTTAVASAVRPATTGPVASAARPVATAAVASAVRPATAAAVVTQQGAKPAVASGAGMASQQAGKPIVVPVAAAPSASGPSSGPSGAGSGSGAGGKPAA